MIKEFIDILKESNYNILQVREHITK